MALKAANDRATMAQISLGVGIASLLLAVTLRRLRASKQRSRHIKSCRAEATAPSLDLEFILEHFARQNDPDYVCLAIAENKLTIGTLLEKVAGFGQSFGQGPRERIAVAGDHDEDRGKAACEQDSGGSSELSDADKEPQGTQEPRETAGDSGQTSIMDSQPWPINCVGYDDPTGTRWVREALAKHLERRQFKHVVDPDKLCIGAGITGILRVLLVALAEQGQACLIPIPHYAGFDWTFKEAEIKRWPVMSPGGGVEVGLDAGISPSVLEEGLRSATRAGLEVRLLLLTSPHNPTGRLYSSKALLAAVAWARKRELHVVVDEAYANCVHRPNASFQSIGKLMMDGPGMGKDVHILVGPGKEMGIPGWRIGAVYSENDDVMAAVATLNHGAQCSRLSTEIYGRLLQDQDFYDKHFGEHEEILRSAYMAVTQTLGGEGILYMNAEAGVFLLVDLREFLEESTKVAESDLWRHILKTTNVNLSPGESLHCPEPGWFRVCYARERDVQIVCRGLERVGACLRALAAKRKGDARQSGRRLQFGRRDQREQADRHGDVGIDDPRQEGAGSLLAGVVPAETQGCDDTTKSPAGIANAILTPAGVTHSGDLGESFVRVEDSGDIDPSVGQVAGSGGVAPTQGRSLDEGHEGQPEVLPGDIVDTTPW